jgi:hypothetical protein
MARPAQEQADVTTVARLPIMIKKFTFGNGTLTGSVINASLHEDDVPGAQVCWRSNCVYANDGGEYTLYNVPSGFQTLVASAEGFKTNEQIAYVVGNTVNYQNIAIIPDVEISGLRYRILVTWDPTPCWPDPNGVDCWDNDLDAHLWRWEISTPITYHIGYFLHYNPFNGLTEYWTDYGDCRGYPNACLERDAQHGYGPETIAIRQSELAMYHIGVFNANQGRPGVPPISQTSAIVSLYDITGLAHRYEIPVDGGDKAFWYVFSLNGDTGEVIEKNCIIDYAEAYNTAAVPQCP